ncbi:hypothetical protein BSKO_05612 [Bryopsis sp. KO-2023]|nr:hypothetical protein BSKO_05612 [Bryopsis sp. KO-2023]
MTAQETMDAAEGTSEACISTSQELPRDVISSILSFLPAKLIARFSCVSTSWSESWRQDRVLKERVDLEYSWRFRDVQPHVVKTSRQEIQAVAREGNAIAIGGRGFLDIWDVASGDRLAVCKVNQSRMICSVCFLGGLVVSGDDQGVGSAWDATSGFLLFRRCMQIDAVWALEAVGEFLASVGEDHYIKLWRAGDSDFVEDKVLYGHQDSISSMCSVSEGSILLSGSDDTQVRVWSLLSGECLNVLKGHTSSIESLAVSDGILASASRDRSLRLWDYEKGECVKVLNEASGFSMGGVCSLGGIAMCGEKLVTNTAVGQLAIWNVNEGECLRILLPEFFTLALSLDKTKLMGLDSYGSLILFDFSVC